ncbi:immunoglobulin superfamily member 10-like [Dermacentor albipictus]|uniref:immunoglobulin superfamily member 10-like n=1 Tax=Dermacentor albipictus TaxID=60249 RepID=UPI0038FCD688
MTGLRSRWFPESCVFVFFLWIATYASGPAQAVRIIELKVPETPAHGSTVTLECLYDLQRDQLLMVQWYKDDREFFRYMPQGKPSKKLFNIKGLTVNVASSTNTTIVLDNVRRSASGIYRCEVVDEPSLSYDSAKKRMDIIEMTLSIDQPPIGVLGGSVRLNCAHDFGGLPLYSFKWFKDGKMLYNYIPRNRPPGELFSVQGVTIDMLQTNYSSLYLKNLSALSAGTYRCEASSDAPPFLTAQDEKMLAVLEQGDKRPLITYDRETYQVGDNVRLNCSSTRSRPAPKLAVYVNDLLLIDADVNASVDTHQDGFQTATLIATFPVRHTDARKAVVWVKCHASFIGLYEAVGGVSIPIGQRTEDHRGPYQQQYQQPQHKQPLQRPSSMSSPQDECLAKAMEILARAWAAYQ